MEEDKMTVLCPRCKKGTKIKKEGSPIRTVKCCNKECGYIGSLMQFQKKEETETPGSSERGFAPAFGGGSVATVIGRSATTFAERGGATIINQQGARLSSSGATEVGYGNGTTMISGSVTTPKPEIGVLQVVSNGQKYRLSVGANIIGRQHSTSQATVQIATDDGYMSRQHMRIDVLPAGYGYEYRISDNNSTNKLTLNGSILAPGDIVILKPSDKITIGRTNLVFIIT